MFPYPFSFLTTSDTGLDQVANNYSMEFDGVNDYVGVGLELPGGWGFAVERTFSLWIKPVSGTYVPFFCGNAFTAAPKFRHAMGCGMVSGKLQLALDYYRASSSYCRAYSELIDGTDPSKDIFDGNWHHIVVYNPVVSTATRADIVNCKMWLDGQPLAVSNDGVPYGTQAVRGLGNGLGIGGGSNGGWSGQEYLDGSVDEFAYWDNYELSDAEVLSIYDATDTNLIADLSSMSTPPTAWYRMGD